MYNIHPHIHTRFVYGQDRPSTQPNGIKKSKVYYINRMGSFNFRFEFLIIHNSYAVKSVYSDAVL